MEIIMSESIVRWACVPVVVTLVLLWMWVRGNELIEHWQWWSSFDDEYQRRRLGPNWRSQLRWWKRLAIVASDAWHVVVAILKTEIHASGILLAHRPSSEIECVACQECAEEYDPTLFVGVDFNT
jgi:hypothetical protein